MAQHYVYQDNFLIPTLVTQTPPHHADLVRQLKQTMQSLKATPTYVNKNLDSCTHVFVRQDHVQKPLDMPYKGPYRVIRRADKYFELDLDGRHDTVSLDRLKPALIHRQFIRQQSEPCAFSRLHQCRLRSDRPVDH